MIDPTRHLVKDHVDSTGARWGVEGAEAVLKLRVLIANGNFDAYFVRHLKCKFQRARQAR